MMGAQTMFTSSKSSGTRYQDNALDVSYKSYFRAMSCALVNMLPFPWRARQLKCVLLGRRYDLSDSTQHAAFLADFSSRLLFTYRYGFPPVTGITLAGAQIESPVGGPEAPLNRKLSSLFRSTKANRACVSADLTSDSGWGCMIRVFQMAQAQVLMQVTFGRDWRRPNCRHVMSIEATCNDCSDLTTAASTTFSSFNSQVVYPWNLLPILSHFRDNLSARFSLHRIVAAGRAVLAIRPGEWFGPTSCSVSMTLLSNGIDLRNYYTADSNWAHEVVNSMPLEINPYRQRLLPKLTLGAFHADNGEINELEICGLFREYNHSDPISSHWNSPTHSEASTTEDIKKGHNNEVSEWKTPAEIRQARPRRPLYDSVVLFISLRLGLDCFNLRYQPFVQSCFGIPQFQGLAGGGPLTSAYWFVAANDDHLYYLDPHSPVQPALQSVSRDWQIIPPPPTNATQSSTDQEDEYPPAAHWKAIACLNLNDRIASKEETDHMFFTPAPQQLPWRALNPSLTLVFLCQSVLEFEDLRTRLKELDTKEEVVHFHQTPPQVHSTRRKSTTPHLDDDTGFLVID